MNRVNNILNHQEYKNKLSNLCELESDRKFCRHDLRHFIDVARIMLIIKLKQNLIVDEEVIYALALLHDMGRVEEYEQGIPHNIASANFSRYILPQCGFYLNEINYITYQILIHNTDKKSIIYIADKLSRSCYCCLMKDECNWSNSNKNFLLKI